jgi:hypothetical protein
MHEYLLNFLNQKQFMKQDFTILPFVMINAVRHQVDDKEADSNENKLLIFCLLQMNHTCEERKLLLTTKKNAILSTAGKWMEVENIILSEVSQAQKGKSCMFSLVCRL